MTILEADRQVPVYSLDPDELTGSRQFRVYTFEGNRPDRADLLTPHRKDHYLIVFIKQGGTRHWVDMTPYTLRSNTVVFTKPGQLIVKEEFSEIWSTGVAFTSEFLSLQEGTALSRLPLIQDPDNKHELALTETDARFVDDLFGKISTEFRQPGEWRQRMLSAYLTVLLTYLSRLYTDQFGDETPGDPSPDKALLKAFQARLDEHFRQVHEVSEYASMLNLSAGYLSEVVKAQSGRPAIKHIHERLVLEARRLLFHTQKPLKEIGFDLGFADTSYFNRFFKRETGVTPAEYRASIRKMYQ